MHDETIKDDNEEEERSERRGAVVTREREIDVRGALDAGSFRFAHRGWTNHQILRAQAEQCSREAGFWQLGKSSMGFDM